MTIARDVVLGCRAHERLSAGGTGTIIGVFSSSFYCRIEGRGIILFHGDGYGIIPFGVGCRDIGSLMAEIRPEPGQFFSCGNLELSIPACGVRVILRPLYPLAASVGPNPELLPSRAISENLAAADRALEGRKGGTLAGIAGFLGHVEGGPPIASPRRAADLWASPPLSRLLLGVRDRDEAVVEQILNRMIGLGTGLTPTMDDLLVGMAYMIDFFNRQWPRGNPRAKILPATISAGAYRRTTEISAAYLESAASGEVFSLLEAAAVSLLTEGGGQGLEANIEALLEVGSDSGGNMLTGMLLAIPLCMDSINLIYGVSK